ncbi:MAG: transcriptional regulator [Psychroserpens sp.]|nr:transcriptional regulator [Psychroserpens sp.]
MTSIHDKITAIINAFNLNNYAFSKRIGVTGTTIDSIVNGRPQPDGSRKRTKPGYDVLLAIINEFEINPDYLFGKSEVMLRSDIPTYSGIPQVISTDNHGEENIVLVSVKARAGYLNGYGDSEYIQSLPMFQMPQLTNGTYRCFEVQGNSMVPTFYSGDYVFGKFIEDLSEIKDDSVYVVVSKDDGVVLKRIFKSDDDTIILKSDNQDGNYPDYSLPTENLMEIWQVTMYASKQIPKGINMVQKLNDLESRIANLQQQFKS